MHGCWVWASVFHNRCRFSVFELAVTYRAPRYVSPQRPFVGAVCCAGSAWFLAVADVPEADSARAAFPQDISVGTRGRSGAARQM